MTLYLALLWTFFKIGLVGFGGGYAMLSMIMAESQAFGVSLAQLADLNALDMVVPGPIAINAATYVGYLAQGLPGAIFSTVGVMLPSFFIVALVMRFLDKYKQNRVMSGLLTGVKPAAVGLIAAAALQIASGVLLQEGASLAQLFSAPLAVVSIPLLLIFIGVAVANIRFKVNAILLTVLAGVIGALFVR